MKRSVSTTVALLIAFSSAAAQMKDYGHVHAELNVTGGIARGALDRGMTRDAFGVGIFLGGPAPGTPIVLGTEIAYLNYGTGSSLRIFDTVFDGRVDRDLAVPVEALRTTSSNNVWLAHLVARLQPLGGTFRPYIDALAGFKAFVTTLDVESDVIVFRNGLSQRTRNTDFAFSYGVGGGIEVQILEIRSGWDDGPAAVALHGGVRYLFGTKADYASGKSFSERDGRIVIEVARSRTDMLMPEFGIRVRK